MEISAYKSLVEYKDVAYLCASSCLNCTMNYPSFTPSCPSLERFGFMSYSSKGRSAIIQAYMSGNLPLSESFAQVIFSCALCGACRNGCQQDWKNYILEVFQAMREEFVEKGKAPALVRDYFKSMSLYSNPYKEPQESRGQWAEGLGVPGYAGQEYLYYVGDVGSYDKKGQQGVKALAQILLKAKVSFGILGKEESSDGNEVNKLGERGLFQSLAENNIEQFNKLGVTKILTISPHAFNAFKNDYPAFGGKYEVVHYTQLLAQLITEGKLSVKDSFKAKITYHDPCFLGRHNEEYEAPRTLLQAIDGVDFVEMERNRETAFCCGGGGGNFATDFLGGNEKAPNRVRIREAAATGAEILAVACPTCSTMLEDGLKGEGLENKLKVMDLAEILERLI